jgi:hypothetical protein
MVNAKELLIIETFLLSSLKLWKVTSSGPSPKQQRRY